MGSESSIRRSSRRETESGLFGKETLAITDCYGVRWVRQRVGIAGDRSKRSYDGRRPNEGRKDGSLNSVHTSAVAEGVSAKTNAAVVFRLFVALKGLLRRQEIGARAEGVYTRGQTENVAANGDRNPRSGIRNPRT